MFLDKSVPALVVLFLALSIWTPTVSFAAVTNPLAPLPVRVNHSMTVRVSILGIPNVDRNQLVWNLDPVIQPNIQTSHNPQGYGTNFTMNYDINSVPARSASDLKNYLKSIANTTGIPRYLQKSPGDDRTFVTFDALKTEEWLNSHIGEFGGIPDNGYLLIVADLSDLLPNYWHYYSIQYNELDKASAIATRAGDPTLFPVLNWMFSWGGHYRFYFIDLSAGDPNVDYTNTGHMPIQDFDLKKLSGEIVIFNKNVHTITDYVADYVSEAVRNLFVPDYLYSPTFSSSYEIVINVFDQTARLSDANIGNYLSTSLIKKAFETLVPYSSWNISLATHQLADDPALMKVVSNSSLFWYAGTNSNGKNIFIHYYNYRQVYSYLQSHLGGYVHVKGDTVQLPMFEFIFDNRSVFGSTSEETVDSFGGVSVGDLALVSSNDAELFDSGFGLTRETIHELGHSMGLMHPFSFGQTEDYVASTMAYSPYEYEFSQFDIDAIQRAHADQFLSQLQGAFDLGAATMQKGTQNAFQQAKSAYQSALAGYSKKDYAQTIKSLQGANQILSQAFDAEANVAQGRISASLATPGSAGQILQQANTLLNSARLENSAGRAGTAFQLLQKTDYSIDEALGTQTQGPPSQTLLAPTSFVELAAGIAIGVFVSFLLMRRELENNRVHRPTPRHRARTRSNTRESKAR